MTTIPSLRCPVCENLLKLSTQTPGLDATRYDCPRCGEFNLTGSLVQQLSRFFENDKEACWKLSHAIFKLQENGQVPMVKTHDIPSMLESPLPSPLKQGDLLIQWLAESDNEIGKFVPLEDKTHGAIIGATSLNGFNWVVLDLIEKGLLKKSHELLGRIHVAVSMKGLEHCKAILSKQSDEAMQHSAMESSGKDEVLPEVIDLFARISKVFITDHERKAIVLNLGKEDVK